MKDFNKEKIRPARKMTGKKKKLAVIYNILLVFFSLVIVFCGFKIGSYYWQGWRSTSENETIIDEVVSTPSLPTVSQNSSSSSGGYTFATIPKSVDFQKLKKKNSEVVGWIFNQNGIINYPIMQAVNNDYYLNHTINKTKNVNGSIFMNYKNKGNFTDKLTFIYGHSMKNGTMFASLLRYRNQSYYNAYPSFYLYTPYGKYKLDVFSAFETTDADKIYSAGYNQKDYSDIISYAFSKSKVKADVTVSEQDRIVVLSTCAYNNDNGRFLVLAKMTVLEEKIPENSSKNTLFHQ
ncbi:MAG: class B sortase [Ruminococcaceae bacterium]|nr:class B sortase [Oscillospiraceae bacterium]